MAPSPPDSLHHTTARPPRAPPPIARHRAARANFSAASDIAHTADKANVTVYSNITLELQIEQFLQQWALVSKKWLLHVDRTIGRVGGISAEAAGAERNAGANVQHILYKEMACKIAKWCQCRRAKAAAAAAATASTAAVKAAAPAAARRSRRRPPRSSMGDAAAGSR